MAGRRLPHFQARSQARCRPGVNRVAVHEAAQVVRQIRGAGKSPRGVLLQTFQANRLQVMRNARLELARRYRLLLDDLADRVDRIARFERWTTDQHLVEDRTERIDVGGRADLPVLSRLPVPAPCNWACPGSCRSCVWLESSSTRLASPNQRSWARCSWTSDPLAARTNRFPGSSTMDDWLPCLASRIFAGLRSRWTMPRWWATSIGARQRLDELGGRTRTRRTLEHPLLEAAAVHELERKIGPTFVLAGLVDLHDVGMKQLGNGFRLGTKPRQADLANMRARPAPSSARPAAASRRCLAL